MYEILCMRSGRKSAKVGAGVNVITRLNTQAREKEIIGTEQ